MPLYLPFLPLILFQVPIFANQKKKKKTHTHTKAAMSIYSYNEEQPTLDGVKRDIAKLIGQDDIKLQLEMIVKKIADNQLHSFCCSEIVPPKPFHMVFMGNNGTGKSMVAEILGKLFYLAGSLTSYNVTEIDGPPRKSQIKSAEGGILVVNEYECYDEKIIEEIKTIMDEKRTSVIFAGTREGLNKLINLNKKLYRKFIATLKFNDFSCEELSRMLHEKIKEETKGFELDDPSSSSSIIINETTNIIRKEIPESLRKELNGYLVNQMLADVKDCLNAARLGDDGKRRIFLNDIANGVRLTARKYSNMLAMSSMAEDFLFFLE